MLGFQTSSYVLGVIPKMVYLFGTIFNDLQIPRMDTDGISLRQLIRVPIIYGPKDKLLARLQADPNLDRKTAITLPIMSFEHLDTQYDAERKLSAMHHLVIEDTDHSKVKTQYTPVPYNFMFDLHIYAETALDLNNIIEQILPFFTPEFTIRANLIPTIGKTWDIPIVYKDMTKTDNYEGKVSDIRGLTVTLHFIVKGHLFGPIVTHPLIKFANVNFFIPAGNNTIQQAIGNTVASDRVTVQPGLTANGLPTSNIALTVPLTTIQANDNFGYITTLSGLLNANTPSGGE